MERRWRSLRCAFALLMRERLEHWDLGCSCPDSFKRVCFKCRVSGSALLTKEQNSRMSEAAEVPEVELVLNLSTSVILSLHLKPSNTCR